ncbi:restriction system protein [Pseudobutyrivibrio sp. C4]|uniref:hypothetical protein n=1 Tax=Pseudobutyrivibrio sp. C4 TaxID=1520803 RepID=UPI0008C58830|nr:hypothetical protein [Pseudobutyrivibrio sp. C4]SES65554.1 restriction system protein [Pseudobutyrivibrio sp. C4]
MIWVCRAGKNSQYIEDFIGNSRIYLPWSGFEFDLSPFVELSDFRMLVSSEKQTDNKTTISNLASQLKSFAVDMQVGDYVLIPHRSSRFYTFAIVDGGYEYNLQNDVGLFHSRKIRIMKSKISNQAFDQSMRYSLGAYRTIFKVKDEEKCLDAIKKYDEKE